MQIRSRNFLVHNLEGHLIIVSINIPRPTLEE
jgi:hypothetical protein